MATIPLTGATQRRTLSRAALALAWRLCLLAGAGAAPLLLAPTADAQDLPEPGEGFEWEQVGDVGIDVRDLAFGPDSTLWATGDDGPFRLDTTKGRAGEWVLVSDYPFVKTLLLLGGDGPDGPAPDTLVGGSGTTKRSVDGGQTWEIVHSQGGGGLYEIPAGYPHAGRILTGATSAIGYSDDRAATFTPSIVPGQPGSEGGADDFVALPPGSSHPGRILAAGSWGVSISDDGGATFRESGLYQAVYYYGEAIGLVGDAAGGPRAVVGGYVVAQPNARVWVSGDAGETWGPGDGQHLLEGPPSGSKSAKAVLSLGGDSVLVVLKRGTVYRSDDAGETWEAIGRAPDISESVFVASAVLGPDGRLYVGLSAQGSEDGWVWRTGERLTVPVGVEPTPEPEPEESLGVEVVPNPFRGEATVTLALAQPGEVEAVLYDVLGRRMAVLASGLFAAGRHEVALAGSALPPGVYVVRASAGEAVATRTVTLLR